MIMNSRTIGTILIFVGIFLTLDQLIRFDRWEWEQTYTLWHHEGIALAAFIAGIAWLARARHA